MRQEEIDIIKGYRPDPCEAYEERECGRSLTEIASAIAEDETHPGFSLVAAPEGYRLLTEGEEMLKGDLIGICRPNRNPAWVESSSGGGKWSSVAMWPMARKRGDHA
jgi:hypothetical protein